MTEGRESKLFMLEKRKPEEDLRKTEGASASASVKEGKSLLLVKTAEITASPYQTRERFDEEELANLARSIQAKGVLQPVLVRRLSPGQRPPYFFELVAGERRLRAAKLAGLEEIPAVIQDVDARDAVEMAVIENAQREDLNPIEEAAAFNMLVQDFDLTQSEIARVIGKSREAVTNSLRLLQLDPRVIDILKQGGLSAGHGRALLAADDKKLQYRLAKVALKRGLSVRALESTVARIRERREEKKKPDRRAEQEKEALKRQRDKLSALLHLEKVDLRCTSEGQRKLTLVFDSESAWRRFMNRLRS